MQRSKVAQARKHTSDPNSKALQVQAQNLQYFTTAAEHFRQGEIQPATPEPRDGDVQQSPGHSHAEPSESEDSLQGHVESRDGKIRDAAKDFSSSS